MDQPTIPGAAQLLDMLPGLVAYIGPDLRYRYVNAAYSAWTGLAREALIGTNVRCVVGRANYGGVSRRLRQALRGETVSAEYSMFDGPRARRVQGTYVPDTAEDGTVRGVVVLVTDCAKREDLQHQIAATEHAIEDAFVRAPIGLAHVDRAGRLLRANEAFAAMLGLHPAELLGIDFRDITHPEDVDIDDRLFRQVLDGQRDGYRLEKRYVHRDGHIIHAVLVVSAERHPDGRVLRFLAQIEDITGARAAERDRARNEARLDAAIEATRGGLWHIDLATGRFEASPHLHRLFGLPPSTKLCLDAFQARVHPDDKIAVSLDALMSGEKDREAEEFRLKTRHGWRWMHSERRLLRDRSGAPAEIVAIVVDVTEQHHRQEQAERLADTDPLTGLLNRRGLDRRLGAAPPAALGVLIVDLDRFKPINDMHGHVIGDAVIAEVGARLQSLMREDDLVVRLGGDEFLVVVPGADEAAVERVATRITAALAAPVTVDDLVVPIGASIGGAVRTPGTPLALAIATADRALYRVKSAGRGAWALAC